ncbi:MAG: hypothetical protein WDO70_00655 [Alphaproteobacteria bacterium]
MLTERYKILEESPYWVALKACEAAQKDNNLDALAKGARSLCSSHLVSLPEGSWERLNDARLEVVRPLEASMEHAHEAARIYAGVIGSGGSTTEQTHESLRGIARILDHAADFLIDYVKQPGAALVKQGEQAESGFIPKDIHAAIRDGLSVGDGFDATTVSPARLQLAASSFRFLDALADFNPAQAAQWTETLAYRAADAEPEAFGDFLQSEFLPRRKAYIERIAERDLGQAIQANMNVIGSTLGIDRPDPNFPDTVETLIRHGGKLAETDPARAAAVFTAAANGAHVMASLETSQQIAGKLKHVRSYGRDEYAQTIQRDSAAQVMLGRNYEPQAVAAWDGVIETLKAQNADKAKSVIAHTAAEAWPGSLLYLRAHEELYNLPRPTLPAAEPVRPALPSAVRAALPEPHRQ